MKRIRVYLDLNDWWIGVYRGADTWYICILPCLVIAILRDPRRL